MGLPRVRGRRLALSLGAVGLLVAAATSDPVHHAAIRALDAAEGVIHDHEVAGMALFAGLSAASAIAFFFSSAVLVPVAVQAWGAEATFALLWGAWLAGAAVTYWLGRHPGRRLLGWLAPGSAVAAYETTISRHAGFLSIVLFQLAVPSEIPGWVLGALRYPFGKFLAAFAIAELPFAAGTVYLGEAFLRRQRAVLVGVALGGIALSAAALYFLRRRLDRRRPR
jgi:uncharacterized membrane protein YdjX (TVP38/TMEM64 family)